MSNTKACFVIRTRDGKLVKVEMSQNGPQVVKEFKENYHPMPEVRQAMPDLMTQQVKTNGYSRGL